MRHLTLLCSAALLLLTLPGCYGNLFGTVEDEELTARPLDSSMEALPASDLF